MKALNFKIISELPPPPDFLTEIRKASEVILLVNTGLLLG